MGFASVASAVARSVPPCACPLAFSGRYSGPHGADSARPAIEIDALARCPFACPWPHRSTPDRSRGRQDTWHGTQDLHMADGCPRRSHSADHCPYAVQWRRQSARRVPDLRIMRRGCRHQYLPMALSPRSRCDVGSSFTSPARSAMKASGFLRRKLTRLSLSWQLVYVNS